MKSWRRAFLPLLLAMTATAQAQPPDPGRADLARLAAALQAQHPAPYRQHSAAEYQAKLTELTVNLTTANAPVAAMALTALAADGHTTARPLPTAAGFDILYPVRIELLADGAHIVAAAPDILRRAAGARVTALNGRPISEVASRLTPLIGVENAMTALERLPRLMQAPAVLAAQGLAPSSAAPLRITLSPAAGPAIEIAVPPGPQSVELASAGPAQAPLYLRAGKPYWLQYLPESRTLYVAYAEAAQDPAEPMAAFTARVVSAANDPAQPVDRLVLDLRRNAGGNNYLNQRLVHALIGAPQNRRGHLYVIIGRATFSAGMNMAADVERNTHAIFVGEPTGAAPNHYGDAQPLDLPGLGVRAFISSTYWQSSDPHDQRSWIAPDIAAPPTFAALTAGRDPALEAILARPLEDASGDRPPNTNWLRDNQKQAWHAYPM